MRHTTFAAAAAFGVLPFLAAPVAAQDVDISGMDCTAAANHLTDVISDETMASGDEERRVEFMITGARQECVDNGNREPLERVARLIEDTNWINQQDWMAGVN